MSVPLSKKTDLLFGIVSLCPHNPRKHYLLVDFDKKREESYEDFFGRLLDKIGMILFKKYDFKIVYVVKSSDRGAHLVSFSRELGLSEYIRILKDLEADERYIEWIEKVSYGVLRISRRSAHWQVPELYAVCRNGKSRERIGWIGGFYLSLLSLEQSMFEVKKVRVFNYKGGVKNVNKKD